MSGQSRSLSSAGALASARAAHDQIVSEQNNLFIYGLVKQALDSLGGTVPPWTAEAWALRADVLVSDYLHRWNGAGPAQLDEAKYAVDQALALDGTLALAHYACGFVKRARGRHDEALAAFDQAIKFDSNFARAYAQKANELINIGQPGQAPPLVQTALDLSPFDPSIAMFYWIMGRAYFMAGFYRDAITWLEKSVDARPTVWYNWIYQAGAYALLGDIANAQTVIANFRAQSNTFAAYTLAKVIDNEKANPNDNPVVKTGRDNLHRGLQDSGF